MQAAHSADEFMSGAKVKMVGVAENNLRAEFFEDFLGHSFNAACRSHRHEHRGFDGLVRQVHLRAASTVRRGIEQIECKAHFVILSGGVE
jgi:hypothetical protein